MSILDQLLGGSDSTSASTNSDSSDFNLSAGPELGLSLSDVLSSSNMEDDGGDMESSEFTGIGDVGLGLAAPVMIGTSSSSESASTSETDGSDGGLLGGLL